MQNLVRNFSRRARRSTAARLALIALAFCAVRGVQATAQIQSGYFVAPSDKINGDTRQYIENKIRNAMSAAGAIPADGYFPMVTVLQYDETEVLELSGMRTMYKAYGEIALQVVMDGVGGKAPALLGAMSFKIEGVGTSKSGAQMTAVRNLSIPEGELKALYQRVSASYRQAAETNCNLYLQEAKKYLAQKQYQESVDAATAVAPTCANYKAAQELLRRVIEEYSETRLRAAQQYFAQERYNLAAEAASDVLSDSKSFAAAQKLLTSIVARRDKQRDKADAERIADKAAERSVEKLRIQTAGKALEAEARASADIARSRAAAEERYNALWLRMMTR